MATAKKPKQKKVTGPKLLAEAQKAKAGQKASKQKDPSMLLKGNKATAKKAKTAKKATAKKAKASTKKC